MEPREWFRNSAKYPPPGALYLPADLQCTGVFAMASDITASNLIRMGVQVFVQ
jgi:hypothetical protein